MPKKNKSKKKPPQARPFSFPQAWVSAKQGIGGRVSIRSLVSHPVFGARLTSNSDTLPAAFVNILGNQTFYQEGNLVMMPDLGLNPVNLVGSQPLSDVTGAVATPDVFTTGTLATAGTVNTIRISPDIFNGPVAAKANLYEKFVFRDILVEYVSLAATSQASGIAICINEDTTTNPTSASTVRQVVPSVLFPLRCDRAFLHYHYRGPNLWYNLADSATVAGDRMTHQGMITAFATANLTVIVPGVFNVYYSLDLYDPVPSQGFTVQVKRCERDRVNEILAIVRLNPEMTEEIFDRLLASIGAFEEDRTPSKPLQLRLKSQQK